MHHLPLRIDSEEITPILFDSKLNVNHLKSRRNTIASGDCIKQFKYVEHPEDIPIFDNNDELYQWYALQK